MSVLFVLVGASLVLAIGFLIAFLLSVKSGPVPTMINPIRQNSSYDAAIIFFT